MIINFFVILNRKNKNKDPRINEFSLYGRQIVLFIYLYANFEFYQTINSQLKKPIMCRINHNQRTIIILTKSCDKLTDLVYLTHPRKNWNILFISTINQHQTGLNIYTCTFVLLKHFFTN